MDIGKIRGPRSTCALLLGSLLAVPWAAEAGPVIANSAVNNGIATEHHVIPANFTGQVSADFTLNAHFPAGTPQGSFYKFSSGNKSQVAPFGDRADLGANELHGTSGSGTVSSAIATDNDTGKLNIFNKATASIQPGRNDPPQGVSFVTRLNDPLTIPAGGGTMSMNASLAAGTAISKGSSIDFSFSLLSGLGLVTNIYSIFIDRSGTNDGILPVVDLGQTSSEFVISFTQTQSEIIQNIIDAFSDDGTDKQVLADKLILGVDIRPIQDTSYSLLLSQGGVAPSVEIPEPPAILLTGMGLASFYVRSRRKVH